jgi:hypothetical protein
MALTVKSWIKLTTKLMECRLKTDCSILVGLLALSERLQTLWVCGPVGHTAHVDWWRQVMRRINWELCETKINCKFTLKCQSQTSSLQPVDEATLPWCFCCAQFNCCFAQLQDNQGHHKHHSK